MFTDGRTPSDGNSSPDPKKLTKTNICTIITKILVEDMPYWPILYIYEHTIISTLKMNGGDKIAKNITNIAKNSTS